ncbi:MAG: 16S rRNA (cytosine(1402)-N(4))-methyltransferase RsmH [Candidatus Omnitrophica bacterium]|nr:16S rRNA (cytosine(1402)-N(4))-methyltransferase RsmH [Candidatus Omnitrophota bacterium]
MRSGVFRLPHEPVLLNEIISILELQPGAVVLDGTVGNGGHAEAILEKIVPSGVLIGLDQDASAIERSRERLKRFSQQVILKQCNFRYLDQALSEIKISEVDAVLLDIGVSQEQLDDAGRGFSFRLEGPLDMRMDSRTEVRASDLIETLPEEELAELFYKYGEERRSRRIARLIVRERAKKAIQTTIQLAELIASAVPAKVRYGRIHPATRVFQALRIAVNGELDALSEGIQNAMKVLKPGGRLAVITFHSLEDRIVKRAFLQAKADQKAQVFTKKPIGPTDSEVMCNPRSRSAKLRAICKL